MSVSPLSVIADTFTSSFFWYLHLLKDGLGNIFFTNKIRLQCIICIPCRDIMMFVLQKKWAITLKKIEKQYLVFKGKFEGRNPCIHFKVMTSEGRTYVESFLAIVDDLVLRKEGSERIMEEFLISLEWWCCIGGWLLRKGSNRKEWEQERVGGVMRTEWIEKGEVWVNKGA